VSAATRARASVLASKYARIFDVPVEDVTIEFREDDIEVYVRGIGIVWTLKNPPYASTLEKSK
jgi:hypothetical protein